MRRTILATAFVLPLGLMGCAEAQYTNDSVYVASCTVDDYSLSPPGNIMPGYTANDFRRPIVATGQDFDDVRQKLAMQGAGTIDRPCSSFSLAPLYPANPVAYHQVGLNSVQAVTADNFTVHFAFNSTDIDALAGATIQAAAERLLNAGDVHITVVGHTDTVGSEGYNQSLSERRAHAVARALYTDGVPKGIVSTFGTGKHDLLVQTGGGEPSRANRRAVIITE